MRSLVLLAMLMTTPPPAALPGGAVTGGDGPGWELPAPAPRPPGIVLAKRQGGNGTQKDRLDANITTDPACRGIFPTDRQAKFDCLTGRNRPSQPPNPSGPAN